MKLKALILGAVLAVSAVAYASVVCSIHTYASCYYTGAMNMGAKKYHCTCGDDVWIRER